MEWKEVEPEQNDGRRKLMKKMFTPAMNPAGSLR